MPIFNMRFGAPAVNRNYVAIPRTLKSESKGQSIINPNLAPCRMVDNFIATSEDGKVFKIIHKIEHLPEIPPPGPPTPPEPEPEPTPGDGTDIFGYKTKYPTKQGGETWAMKMSGSTPKEARFDPKDIVTKNADGSFKCKSTKVRMNVFISKGYHPERITQTGQMALAAKGYMQDPEDFKNCEMTGGVRVNKYDKMDNFAWYWRGGRHSDVECEGTSYKNDLYFDGSNGWKKEQWHSGGYTDFTNKKTDAEVKAAFAAKKFVIFKATNYNDKDGNVVLELDASLDDGKTFKPLNRMVDKGGWGDEGDHCGGAPDQKITWGGPIATFRWDNATDVDFKNFSIREIVPPT